MVNNINIRSRKITLQFRIFTLISILVVSGMIVICFFFLDKLEERMYDEFTKRGKLIVKNFSSNSMEGILIEDINTLELTIQKLFNIEDIIYASIYDSEQTMLAGNGRTLNRQQSYVSRSITKLEIFEVSTDDSENIPVLVFNNPVFDEDNIYIGWVQLGVSLERIDHEIKKMTIHSLALLVILIVVGSITSYWVANNIAKPINNLTTVSKIIAGGNLDHEIDTSRSDEIGSLSKSFAFMRDSIRDKIQLLENEAAKREQLLNTLSAKNEELQKNIDERCRAENEKLELEKRLRHTEKMQAIGELAGGIAHDFNNQLTVIRGFADVLVYQLDNESDMYDSAKRISKATERSADLISQLLAFARKGKFISDAVDIHQIIGEAVAFLEHSIDKRIQIQQHLTASPHIVLGDASQLENAILNIAINARDAMPKGGKIILYTEVVSLDHKHYLYKEFEIDPGPYVLISISDTGIGIDEETKKRIFEPFYTTKKEGSGTGMGLAAVYGTVRNHGGAIITKSKMGHGTTFRVYLPLMNDPVKSENKGESTHWIKGKGSILMVDDEEEILGMTSGILKNLGYTVTTCANGEEAVNYYRESASDVDVVILDIIMPKLNGTDTFRELCKINPNIKVIICSGYSINGEVQALIDKGAVFFVPKPFEIPKLSKILADAFEA